ncbi:amylosucrase [Clostridiales bacterium]|nr:amylosucrase [Clostridiales bacterium]
MKQEQEFEYRSRLYYDELKWLYMELYGNKAMLDDLMETARRFYEERKPRLKRLDRKREQSPAWYGNSSMVGMMVYADQFAHDLAGVQEHLDHLKQLKVSYLHLMPLLKMPKDHNDGGYAVSDFRQVDERIGTMEQLSQLADLCQKNHISVCLDFVINHTSNEHEWALRAKNGEKEYQDRYLCFDDYSIPAEYEKTTPQVFPNTNPGNFIYDEQMGKYVMSTFHGYQWDLNYRNPAVFNEMAANLLFLANVGIDVFRVDAVPYIWKQLGTTSRNLPQVHSIMRMLRMLCKMVCPAVAFKGEVVMAPHEVAPYFGSVGKPECDILYNVTTMACVWNSLATRDVTLLKWQMDAMDALPREYTFVNYVRCHDDIGWGLDENAVRSLGLDPLEHKKFLYRFYAGDDPSSFARGRLYNYDPVSQDARSCGTCASLCGVEKAFWEDDPQEMELALRRHVLIHAYIASLGGIPVIYSGDEIAQLNDYSYEQDPKKSDDARFLHRGEFRWQDAALIHKPGSREGRVYAALRDLIRVRTEHKVFDADAWEHTWETFDKSVLAFERRKGTERFVGIYNFCEEKKDIPLGFNEAFTELFSGRRVSGMGLTLEPYEYLWLLRT